MRLFPSRKLRCRGELILFAIVCLFFMAIIFLVVTAVMKIGASVVYEPPILIPLAITVDNQGHVSLSTSVGEVPTPLGIFEFKLKKTIDPPTEFQNKKVLTVVVGDKEYFYDLGDKSFTVNIPNDKNGQSTIRYDAATGNIFVEIPQPVWMDGASPKQSKSGWPRKASRVVVYNGQSSSGIITVMAGCGSSMSSGPHMATSLTRRGAQLSLRT
jgi:hypothetical protein